MNTETGGNESWMKQLFKNTLLYYALYPLKSCIKIIYYVVKITNILTLRNCVSPLVPCTLSYLYIRAACRLSIQQQFFLTALLCRNDRMVQLIRLVCLSSSSSTCNRSSCSCSIPLLSYVIFSLWSCCLSDNRTMLVAKPRNNSSIPLKETLEQKFL